MILMPSSQEKNGLLPVKSAQKRILDALTPLDTTTVPIGDALGRFLAKDIRAMLTLPPHDISAMDGYAVKAADVVSSPVKLTRIGESAAGHPWSGRVESGQAVRIFTGACVPNGADTIIIQENVDAPGECDNVSVTVNEGATKGNFVRQAGLDIKAGDVAIAKGTCLTSRSIGLATAVGATRAEVSVPPRVGILSTGDELVTVGQKPGPGQIISSNAAFLDAFITSYGATAVNLGIVNDRPAAVKNVVAARKDLDLVVTTGGASVGNHDHIASDLAAGNLDFWKIAMRPGKPLIWGKVGSTPLLGLPGNPVSTAVCALIFLAPAIGKLSGGCISNLVFSASVTIGLPQNDLRQDYIRASIVTENDGQTRIRPARRQDSSMMATLASANAFIVRPPFDPPKAAGDLVKILPMPHLF